MSSGRFLLCLFFMAFLSFVPSFGATGEIDATTRYQTIEGFGAANVWSGATLVSLGDYNPAIYDVIFGDLGLDILRLRNTYGYEQSYINNCQHIITNGRARTGRPLKIMISAWSPQASLKSNGSIPGGDDATLDGGPYNYVYQDYADWWADSLEQYASRGMVADYVNMQNEPDFDAPWDSCRFEPYEDTSIAGYNEAFDAVYTEINSRVGSTISVMPKMLVSDCTGLDRAGEYIDCIYNPSQVYGYSHHLYNCFDGGQSGCATNPDNYIPAMTGFGSSYNDKPIIQTEYSDDDHVTTYQACMDLAVLMHNSLVVEGASGYLYWQLTWTDTGLVAITSGSWTINPVYYAMKHYSAFTDPNWQRIEANVDDSDLRISAFIGPQDQQISIIIINTQSNDFDVNFPITGFSICSGEYYRTSQTENCKLIGSYDGSGPLTIPGNSITTIVFWSDDPPLPPTGLAATPGNFQVSIDWLDNNEVDIDGYNIYRSQTSGSGYVKLNGSLLDSTDYIDTDVNVAQTYYYVVKAVDKCSVESGYSLEASAVPFDIDAPEPPTGLVSQAGNSTVSLDWNDNIEEDVNGYNVYRSQSSGSGYVKVNDSLVSSSDYVDDTALNEVTYYYVVTAVDIYSNESGHSSEVPATPSLVPPTIYNFDGITASNTEYDAFACNVDTFPFEGSRFNVNSRTEATDQEYINISANNTAEWTTADPSFLDEFFLWVEMKINEAPEDINRIDLTFNGNTSGSADVTHQIYVLKAGTNWTKNNSWVQVGSDMDITPGVDTTMTRSITSDFGTYIDDANGKLTWAVYETASFEVMNINYLEASVAGIGDTEPPAAPSGLIATADNNLVNLDWNDNSETDLAGYDVYRSGTSGSGYDKINTSLLADSNYVDNDVNNFTSYYYVVTAADTSSNSSAYSNEASATPDIYQDCNEVQLGGHGLVSDLTGNCYVNLEDLEIVSFYWLNMNCSSSGNCGGADFTPVNGDVDLEDFSDFAMDWMKCNNPGDSSCIKNWWP